MRFQDSRNHAHVISVEKWFYLCSKYYLQDRANLAVNPAPNLVYAIHSLYIVTNS